LSDAPTPASFGEVGHKRLLSGGVSLRALDVARACGRVLLPILVVATLLALALELGLWTREELRHGPFPVDGGAGSHAVSTRIGEHGWLACCLRPHGDTSEDPFASDLKLWVGEREMGPAHAMHADIRWGGTTAFSHWGEHHVIFALPPNVENSPATRVTVRYAMRPGRTLLISLALASISVALVLYRGGELRHPRRILMWVDHRWLRETEVWTVRVGAAWLVQAPLLAMRGVGYLLALASSLFIATSVYAAATGWALPTTAVIRWSSWARWAAQHEPRLPHVLLALAALGAVASWLSPAVGVASAVRRNEIALARFLRLWGPGLAACMFVFCISAIWAGQARNGDMTTVSIVGLVPWSDAANYWASAHDQARDGVWGVVSLRRPVAAALRSVLMFVTGFSYANVLLLQAVLVAGAACIGAWWIARWRGVYAGLAYFGLSYVVVRSFLPTFLTEPLASVWALLAVPFFVETLRTGSWRHGSIGFAMTCVALAARPGSMFTVPALAVWLIYRLGHAVGQKVRIAVYATAIVVSILAADYALHRAYGASNQVSGGNFSYTLCGLSIGTDWRGCVEKYEAEYRAVRSSERTANDFMFRKAFENIRARPGVIATRLLESAVHFVDSLREVLWRGYYIEDQPPRAVKLLCFGVAAFGLIFVVRRRRERGEALFWVLVWVAAIASAAFVYLDDGRRVMIAAYPLLCVFVASGFAVSGAGVPHDGRAAVTLTRYGFGALLVATALCFAVPGIAYATSPVRQSESWPRPRDGEHIVLAGRRMSGVLVVPNGATLRPDVPSIHLSDFARLIERSGVERYQGFLHPAMPPLPFGFVVAPRVQTNWSSDVSYIVPPEVIERRDAAMWRFSVREWQRTSEYGPYWVFVERAEPFSK